MQFLFIFRKWSNELVYCTCHKSLRRFKVEVVPQGFRAGRVARGQIEVGPGTLNQQRAELEILAHVFKTDAQLSTWPDR